MDFLEQFIYSSSSESSASEDENVITAILPEILKHHQKNELYVENIVPLYSEQEFLELFKVPKKIVHELAEEYQTSEFYPKKDTGFLRISSEKCIVIFCWYASHEAASYRDVADRFNIALSTLNIIVKNVTHFLSYKAKDVILWQNEHEKEEILNDFANMGFPSVLGCLDGSHVLIDKPSDDHESYLNRKKFYSVQVQAVCDAKRKIRDVFIGFPGSVHDARVFNNSPLSQTLVEKCQDKIILADSAYPCLRNLLTPYKDTGNLSATEKNFNVRLSHCRIVIEHTFGILKQKFRQLYHLKLRSINLICHFIRACCVLHNLCISNNFETVDNFGQDVNEINEEQDNQIIGIQQDNVAGQTYRNYIAAVLYNE